MADTVVLLTTWNRPSLLGQALPQVAREAARIGAQLVVADDGSTDHETLRLLQSARDNGAEVLCRPPAPEPDRRRDGLVHAGPRDRLRKLVTTTEGAELISRCVRLGHGSEEMQRALGQLWRELRHHAYVSAQRNNLSAFRHVLTRYPEAAWILKVDDDVVMRHGAFELMRRTWSQADGDGHDVLAVSGIRTVNERLGTRFAGYAVTAGICNVAVLYRRDDWEQLLQTTPDRLSVELGFDLAFAREYAPRQRPGAVAICVSPSVVYHAGHNGINVRDSDVNCDYTEPRQRIAHDPVR